MLRIIIICCVMILTACGQADIQIQAVALSEATLQYNHQATQTPNPQNLLFFTDEATGIYFLYPATWSVNTFQGAITITDEKNTLVIEYDWFQNSNRIPKNEISEDAFEESDPIHLLGDEHTTYLHQQGQTLYYTTPQATVSSFAPFIVANIGFSIWLEFDETELSSEIRKATDAIVESFGFTWLVTRADADTLSSWNSYHDTNTDLQLHYPNDWRVNRTSDAIIVQHDDVRLVLSVGHGASGIAAGDLRKGDPSHIWLNSMAVPRVYLVYEDKVKMLFYGQPGDAIAFGEYNIVAIFESSSTLTYESIDLTPDLLHEIDMIVTTLEF